MIRAFTIENYNMKVFKVNKISIFKRIVNFFTGKKHVSLYLYEINANVSSNKKLAIGSVFLTKLTDHIAFRVLAKEGSTNIIARSVKPNADPKPNIVGNCVVIA
jgi:hypothetical protein